MNSFKCTRFPRFAKLGIRFTPFLNESVDLEKFGGEFTNDEIAEMVLSFGETDNLMDGGWILPTGEVLDFRRSDMSNNAIRHSRIYLAFSPERKALLQLDSYDIIFLRREMMQLHISHLRRSQLRSN